MNERSIQKYHQHIINRIFTIRNKQVMLDEHLADLYGIETKYLNRAVKRNPERFPDAFMFQLSKEELDSLRFQIGASMDVDLRFPNGAIDPNKSLRFQNGALKTGRGKHRKYLPFVYTEQGAAMFSAVLNSETAIKTSVTIMDAFVQMRHFLMENACLVKRIQKVETQQIETGASLKDLGKKWFAFSKMEKDSLVIFKRLGV
ncbi:MAG: ORF6N domain-containing protein [Bacteroidales bacterium]|nr:ORF6N domain-containing protein [Bacteroidales bacterium]